MQDVDTVGGDSTLSDANETVSTADHGDERQMNDAIEAAQAEPDADAGETDAAADGDPAITDGSYTLDAEEQAFIDGQSGQSGAGGQQQPASDGTNGKSEYTVGEGETLETVAEANGQTVDDLLLTNPGLTEDTAVSEGMTIEVYDPTRLEIARAMSETTDQERLNKLVREEIVYAGLGSSTPEDLLPAIQADIAARQRAASDETINAVIEEQSAWASQPWQAQGRTHEVMDRLNAMTQMTGSGSPDSRERAMERLRDELVTAFRVVAETSPTQAAIEGQRDIFAAYGPQDPFFAEALNDAFEYYTTVQGAMHESW
jgi:LysM repeat protein